LCPIRGTTVQPVGPRSGVGHRNEVIANAIWRQLE
jgi:hypothetical protein